MNATIAVIALLQVDVIYPAYEGWTCVQDAYGGGPPVILYLTVDEDVLRERTTGAKYVVVHNSASELIATYPSVGPLAGSSQRAVNARTIVIDKLSGDMIASNIDLWASGDENQPVNGRCARTDRSSA